MSHWQTLRGLHHANGSKFHPRRVPIWGQARLKLIEQQLAARKVGAGQTFLERNNLPYQAQCGLVQLGSLKEKNTGMKTYAEVLAKGTPSQALHKESGRSSRCGSRSQLMQPEDLCSTQILEGRRNQLAPEVQQSPFPYRPPQIRNQPGWRMQQCNVPPYIKERPGPQWFEPPHVDGANSTHKVEGESITVPRHVAHLNGTSSSSSKKELKGVQEEDYRATSTWSGLLPRIGQFSKLMLPILWTVTLIFFGLALQLPVSHAQSVQAFKKPTALFEDVGHIYPAAAWAQVVLKVPVNETMTMAAKLSQKVKEHFQASLQDTQSEDDKWLANLIYSKLMQMDGTLRAVDYEIALELQRIFPDPKNWDVGKPIIISRPCMGLHTENCTSPKGFDLLRPGGPFPIFDIKRKKRSIQVNVDAASTLSVFFEGVSNLFHAPTLKQLSHKVTVVAGNLASVAHRGQQSLDILANLTQYVHTKSWSAETWMTLHTAQMALDKIATAAPFLADGRMPPTLLAPGEALQVHSKVNTFARSVGLGLPFSTIFSLLAMPATAKREQTGDWSILLHVPLIDHRHPFEAVAFPNAPFTGPHGKPHEFKGAKGIIGTTKALPDEIRAVFIPEAEIHRRCLRFNTTLVCPETPIIKDAMHSCPAGLLLGHNACQVQEARSASMPMVHGNRIFAYLPNDSYLAIHCPGHPPEVSQLSGQILVTLLPNCQVSTDLWTHTSPKEFQVYNVTEVGLSGLPGWGSSIIGNFGLTRHPQMLQELQELHQNLSKVAKQLHLRLPGSQRDAWHTQNIVVVSVTLSMSITLGSGMAWLIYRICHADKVTDVPAKQNTDGEDGEVAQNPSASEDARVPEDTIPTDADTQDHVEEDYA